MHWKYYLLVSFAFFIGAVYNEYFIYKPNPAWCEVEKLNAILKRRRIEPPPFSVQCKKDRLWDDKNFTWSEAVCQWVDSDPDKQLLLIHLEKIKASPGQIYHLIKGDKDCFLFLWELVIQKLECISEEFPKFLGNDDPENYIIGLTIIIILATVFFFIMLFVDVLGIMAQIWKEHHMCWFVVFLCVVITASIEPFFGNIPIGVLLGSVFLCVFWVITAYFVIHDLTGDYFHYKIF